MTSLPAEASREGRVPGHEPSTSLPKTATHHQKYKDPLPFTLLILIQ